MPIRMQRPLVRPANPAIARPAAKHVDKELTTADHDRWRRVVIERANGKCQGTGPHSAGVLDADHIVERRTSMGQLRMQEGVSLQKKNRKLVHYRSELRDTNIKAFEISSMGTLMCPYSALMSRRLWRDVRFSG